MMLCYNQQAHDAKFLDLNNATCVQCIGIYNLRKCMHCNDLMVFAGMINESLHAVDCIKYLLDLPLKSRMSQHYVDDINTVMDLEWTDRARDAQVQRDEDMARDMEVDMARSVEDGYEHGEAEEQRNT